MSAYSVVYECYDIDSPQEHQFKSQRGFTTTSEALFLGKKLWCIPIHGQYEQECNYLALKQLGLKDYGFNLLGVMEFYDDSHKVIGRFPQNIDEHLSQIISHKT